MDTIIERQLSATKQVKVYENILIAIKYRGGNLISPHLTSSAVMNQLRTNNMIKIEAERGEHILGPARIIIYQLAPESKIAGTSADFKKSIGADITKIKKIHKEQLEILIISEEKSSRYVQKIIDSIKDASCRISSHLYSIFICESPQHISISEHKIADVETVKFLNDVMCVAPNMMPQIREREAQMVWIGARPGMVIQIGRLSENSGIITGFRICVPGDIEIDKKKEDNEEESSEEAI